MRLWRVGGDWRPSKVASRRCFSTMMPSMSSSRAMSVRSGVMGIDRVARRTLVDILEIKINRFTACSHFTTPLFETTAIPLHLVLGQILAHLPRQMVEAVESAGVEESVPRLPEDRGNLVVVVGHELWLGRLLGEGEEAVDVLDGLKRFLKDKTEGKGIGGVFWL